MVTHQPGPAPCCTATSDTALPCPLAVMRSFTAALNDGKAFMRPGSADVVGLGVGRSFRRRDGACLVVGVAAMPKPSRGVPERQPSGSGAQRPHLRPQAR
jgi:hypothetical protein